MRKSALILATLPLLAGFAVPAMSQTMPVAGVTDQMHLRMSQLENQIRDLTGQVEQREYQLRQLQQSYDAFVESTNQRLRALEGGAPAASTPSAPAATHVPQPTAPAQDTPPADTTDYNAPYNPNGVAGNLGQMQTPAAPSDTVTSGRPITQNAAQAYDQAFGYLQDKNYTDAENAFQDFLKNHGTHALAANAQYWLGEAYYAQSQYTAAARTFAKAFQDYPNGQKSPDALFKLALTLDKMNKKDDACLTLAELKKRFPTGPASILRRADEESARMQCQP